SGNRAVASERTRSARRRGGLAQESTNRVGGLGSDADPVVDARAVESDCAILGHRVVGPELLEEAPIPGRASVGGDDSVKGALLGATASEPDLDGHWCLVKDCWNSDQPLGQRVGEASLGLE